MFKIFKKTKYREWPRSYRQHEKVIIKGLTIHGIKELPCIVIGREGNNHVVSYPSGGFGIFPDHSVVRYFEIDEL